MTEENTKPRHRLLTLDALRALPEPQWLVRDILPEKQLSVLYGPYGCGKSFVALDIACCIATGTPWHGHPVQYGSVVYCSLEGVADMAARVNAWLIEHEIEDIDNLRVMPDTLDLTSGDAVLLIEAIRAAGIAPKLLVVDTYARATSTKDMNSTKDASEAVAGAERIAAELSAAVLVVHHSGWSDTSRVRNSSALPAACSANIKVSITKRGDNKLITVACEREKDADDFAPMKFALAGVHIPGHTGKGAFNCVLRDIAAEEEEETKASPKMSEYSDRITTYMAQVGRATWDDLLRESGCPPTSKGTLSKVIGKLKDHGDITIEDGILAGKKVKMYAFTGPMDMAI